MNESSRIAAVHKYLPSDLIKVKMRTLGNNGIPDAYYAGDRRALWIEYKQARMPSRPTTLITPNLSALQKAWLERHSDFDINSVWVVVFTTAGHFLLKTRGDWGHGFLPHKRGLMRYKDLAHEIEVHISYPRGGLGGG